MSKDTTKNGTLYVLVYYPIDRKSLTLFAAGGMLTPQPRVASYYTEKEVADVRHRVKPPKGYNPPEIMAARLAVERYG